VYDELAAEGEGEAAGTVTVDTATATAFGVKTRRRAKTLARRRGGCIVRDNRVTEQVQVGRTCLVDDLILLRSEILLSVFGGEGSEIRDNAIRTQNGGFDVVGKFTLQILYLEL